MKKHVLALAMAASMAALTACGSMPGMGVTQAPATEAAKTEAAKAETARQRYLRLPLTTRFIR